MDIEEIIEPIVGPPEEIDNTMDVALTWIGFDNVATRYSS